jgi:ribosomal protein S18 acetylase RimI-like enzyme
MIIRTYEKEDLTLLGPLYKAVTAKENAKFWWIGDEENWVNVYCAFENDNMIAKGQVEIINIVPSGRAKENKHAIYVNLKTIPERENDTELLEQVYNHLFKRALHLKETLPTEYNTMLCVGNDPTEHANNQFFIDKGYKHLNRLFCMVRNLNEDIPTLPLREGFTFSLWQMETAEEEQDYLRIEAEIWPDTPLGLNRLRDYKKHPHWTSMTIHQDDTLVAGLMAWQEEDYGVIEDVFVREEWRQNGLAKYLLAEGLQYLKELGLAHAMLVVSPTNDSALSLYESVGFYRDNEEVRYYIDLV